METCFISEDFMKEYLRDMHPDAVIKNARIEDVDISLFRSSLVLVFHINYGNSCFQGYMSPLLTGDSKEGWTDKGAGNFISNFIRVFGIDEQVDLQSIKGNLVKFLVIIQVSMLFVILSTISGFVQLIILKC